MKTRHTSPLQLAGQRILRSRLAMIGLVLVGTLAGLVVIGPMVMNEDPQQLRPWLGAQPPGFQHPECGVENQFVIGRKPDAPPVYAQAHKLNIQIKQQTAESYRIVLRRGRISRITRQRGAESLTMLRLDPYKITKLLPNGQRQTCRLKGELRRGTKPPAGLFQTGKRVLLLELSPLKEKVEKITIQLTNGRVQKIAKDGTPVHGPLTLRAPDILRVTADGRPLLRRHWLGTDKLGRDLLCRILYGGRISLMVGVVATLVSLVIGVLYGAVSGYSGGRTDRLMMAGVDILYAIPFMFLVILLLVSFGRNLIMLFIALGAVQWLTMARIVRGQVLSLKAMEYIEAARLSGAGPWRILLRHLIPHTLGPVVVYTTLTVPAVILEESFLAFIGLSVQYRGQNLDSWGALVQQGMVSVGVDGSQLWLLLGPTVAMALTLLGLNCLGDGLRDCLDPRLRKER